MCKLSEVNKGDLVRFTYRDNSKVKLQGYVVSVLTNTIVVDISEDILKRGCEEIEPRQVVKHGHYKQRYK
ncbi:MULTISPECIES: DUF2187 family protein [Bacillus]|uniref:DUF2187 domain-containing protein n=2 Tax=Bacillus cereus group TaxID=86661 RepID=A0A2A7D1E4_BACAN|nr:MULTISPECIES: DUF2187 family protein [Bacillus]HDR4561262.1 DUF2187 family protein [Bacillus luti]MCP1163181.1 DUF2187 family protein [Bacillus sp. 1813sda1]MDC7972449.1 DUF2187 family protein [Bacillus sp. BLCC-B18]OTW65096.1 DUF2187 domain-containing protein [Bacillus thuringiensis serovar coreanensis]OTX49073.1 DUF2187 domain-containing protein [Bacillus thuringiensis serovar sooncheon]